MKAEVLSRSFDKIKNIYILTFTSIISIVVILGLLYLVNPVFYQNSNDVILIFTLLSLMIIGSIITVLFIVPKFKQRIIIGIAGVTVMNGDKLIKKYAWTDIHTIEILAYNNRHQQYKDIIVSNGKETTRMSYTTKNSVISVPYNEEVIRTFRYYAKTYDLQIK